MKRTAVNRGLEKVAEMAEESRRVLEEDYETVEFAFWFFGC